MTEHQSFNVPVSTAPSTSVPPATPADSTTPPHPTRRFLIRFAIVATAATFMTMTALLYYFWWKRPAGASALIVVVGDAGVDGATVRVQGTRPPDYVRTLNARNQFVARISLPPGTYLLEVEHRDEIIFRKDLLSLREGLSLQLDLTEIRKPASPQQPPKPQTPKKQSGSS